MVEGTDGDRLLEAVTHCVAPTSACCTGASGAGWTEPGAYILLLHLPGALTFARGGLEHLFLPGWYAYAGSAYGPGGLGGCIRRHLRRDKTAHWHIDSLTNVADESRVIAVPDGNECKLGRGIMGSGMFRVALAGFGSSDCRSCESHLFQAMTPLSVETIATG